MKKFNFEDGIFELDSLLLCNISVPSATAGAPATVQDPETDTTVNGADKTKKTEGGDTVPAADDTKDKKDPGKTTLQKPTKPVTPENTKDVLNAMGMANEAITSITELLQQIIKMNRERKDMEMKMLWSECQNVCNNITKQADNIRSDALKNMIVGIVCSAVTIGVSAMSMANSISGLKELGDAKTTLDTKLADKTADHAAAIRDFQATNTTVEMKGKYFSACADAINAFSKAGQSVNDYFSKLTEAENKEIDASNEMLRTAMEEIKKTVDDARNSITSCQSNFNELLQSNRQTMNKVLG